MKTKSKFKNRLKFKVNQSYADIDEGMIDILNNLNKKGYKTVYSCEGHLDDYSKEYNHRIDLYISFDKEYDFKIPFPKIEVKGKKPYTKLKTFKDGKFAYYWFSSKNVENEQKEQERKEELERLLKWSEEL